MLDIQLTSETKGRAHAFVESGGLVEVVGYVDRNDGCRYLGPFTWAVFSDDLKPYWMGSGDSSFEAKTWLGNCWNRKRRFDAS